MHQRDLPSLLEVTPQSAGNDTRVMKNGPEGGNDIQTESGDIMRVKESNKSNGSHQPLRLSFCSKDRILRRQEKRPVIVSLQEDAHSGQCQVILWTAKIS